jgi:hypothetical protein
MTNAAIDAIARAVLYEGYLLYPYRGSAVKNQRRWTFGGVYPRAYSETQRGTDRWVTQTQCLVEGTGAARLDVSVRFLHLVERAVAELERPVRELGPEAESLLRPVEALRVDGMSHRGWQEAAERTISVPTSKLEDLVRAPVRSPIEIAAGRELEPMRAKGGDVVGAIRRDWARIAGALDLSADHAAPGVFRVTLRVTNTTPLPDPSEDRNARVVPRPGNGPESPSQSTAAWDRERALLHTMASTHALFTVTDGAFVSLTDPPEALREAAAACANEGVWPVLVGEDGQRDTLLASPIILEDYPRVAQESPGDLFDSAEIDEILSLRILTLTDAEKAEIVDERARQVLERTEALDAEQLMKLHGTMRNMRVDTGDE